MTSRTGQVILVSATEEGNVDAVDALALILAGFGLLQGLGSVAERDQNIALGDEAVAFATPFCPRGILDHLVDIEQWVLLGPFAGDTNRPPAAVSGLSVCVAERPDVGAAGNQRVQTTGVVGDDLVEGLDDELDGQIVIEPGGRAGACKTDPELSHRSVIGGCTHGLYVRHAVPICRELAFILWHGI